MAKPNLGDKHVCPNCETRYFDMGKTPPTCPKCETVIEIGKSKAKSKPEPVEEPAEEVAETPEDILEDDLDIEVDDDLDNDEDDDDLLEDASDLGGGDDIPAVPESIDET